MLINIEEVISDIFMEELLKNWWIITNKLYIYYNFRMEWWSSKRPWTKSITITRKLVRNACSQPCSRTPDSEALQRWAGVCKDNSVVRFILQHTLDPQLCGSGHRARFCWRWHTCLALLLPYYASLTPIQGSPESRLSINQCAPGPLFSGSVCRERDL